MADVSRGGEPRDEKGGDLSLEIAKYEGVMAQDPKSRAFALLAEAYRRSGRYEDAIRTAQAGLQHYPFYLSGRMALGRAHYDAGQKDRARQELEKVVTAAPDNLMAHRLLADIYAGEGRMAEAAKSLRMVVLLDPRDESARRKLMGIAPQETAPPPAMKGDEGIESLLELHRYEETPAPASTAPPPGMKPLSDQELIHRPELSARQPEAIPVGKPAAAVPEEAPEEAFEELGGLELEEPEIAAPEEPEEAVPEVIPEAIPAHAAAPPPPVPESSPWETVLEEMGTAEETPDELNTETLAEIYVQQGFYEKALAIYSKMADAHPGTDRLRQKCEELRTLVRMAGRSMWSEEPAAEPQAPAPPEAQAAAPPAPAPPRLDEREAQALATLQGWLERVRTERR